MDAADASLLDSVTAGSSKIIAGSDKVAILMALVAALAPLDFGMTLGFTSPAIIGMESGEKGSWMYGAVFDDAEVQSDHSIVSSQAALFGSMVNVGAMLGALLAGPIANTAGRKLAIATAAVPWIVAWLGIGFGSSFGVILAARVLSGVAVGIASMTVPLYIAETAPASLRGALGAVNQLAVTVGIFFVYLLGYLAQATQPTIFTAAEMACPSQMYNHTAGGVCETELAPWRVLALVGAAVAVVLLLSALLVLPETPPFLASKGRAAAARRVLGRLRTSDAEAAEELEAMLRTQAPSPSPSASTDGAATHDEMGGRPVEEMGDFAADTPPAAPRKEGGLRGLLAPGARWPLAIGCLLMVVFYSSSILRSGGIDDPNKGGLVVMAVQVVMTLVAVLLVDRAGRRVLLLVSLAGMAVSAAALATFHLNDQQPTWLALAALVAYIVSFSLGLGAIPWLIMGEIFPGHVRALGASVATMLNWTCSFIVTETFDYVRVALGPAGTFLGFCAVCVAGFVFVAACVPETKGKSLEEIEALFR